MVCPSYPRSRFKCGHTGIPETQMVGFGVLFLPVELEHFSKSTTRRSLILQEWFWTILNFINFVFWSFSIPGLGLVHLGLSRDLNPSVWFSIAYPSVLIAVADPRIPSAWGCQLPEEQEGLPVVELHESPWLCGKTQNVHGACMVRATQTPSTMLLASSIDVIHRIHMSFGRMIFGIVEQAATIWSF